MNIERNPYREQQLRTMLSHESNPNETPYGANLSHWAGDSKPITVNAAELALLADAYGGKYVEVNAPAVTYPPTDKYQFWCNYEYEDENYPLFFVHLPHLTNLDMMNLLREFDMMYGDTNQETPDWSLEFQVLTRMLIHNKSLLVNPKYIDLFQVEENILALIPEEDRADYAAARKIQKDELWAMYQATL